MWAELPNAQCEVADHVIKIEPVQFSVGIIENGSILHAQNLAGVSKFFAAHRSKLLITLCATTISCGLARCEADDKGFYSPIGIKTKRSTKISCLIIGMSSNAHETQHGIDC